MEHRRWWAIAAVIWIAGVAVLSFLPGQDKHDLHTKGRFHALGHCVVFLVAAMLVAPATRSVRWRLLLLLLVALLGVGVEFTQHVISHMDVEWADIRTDLLGVVLGALLLALGGGLRGAESQPASRFDTD